MLIALIEAAATLLWCYAALSLVQWLIQVTRLDRRHHVPAAADLLSHLVPAMILLVLTVLAGALIGLPSVVAFIAILFPAGLAYGLHMALEDMEPPPTRAQVMARLAFAIVLAGAIVLYRQVL